jgi:hypothetical protein
MRDVRVKLLVALLALGASAAAWIVVILFARDVIA